MGGGRSSNRGRCLQLLKRQFAFLGCTAEVFMTIVPIQLNSGDVFLWNKMAFVQWVYRFIDIMVNIASKLERERVCRSYAAYYADSRKSPIMIESVRSFFADSLSLMIPLPLKKCLVPVPFISSLTHWTWPPPVSSIVGTCHACPSCLN